MFRDLLEDKKTSLNLLATSISLWRSNTSIDYNELCVEVSEVSYNLSLIDYLSIIFISDKCVFEKLVPLALSFIRILTSNSLPNWCRSAVARIKAFCNAEISQSLSQKEVIRLVETEYNVSYYDTEIPQNILSPIEGIASFEKARRTGRFDKAKKIMPLKQIGINFGFDKIIFSLLVSASLFIFVYLFVYPTSKAIHVVKDLHRAEKYNQFELTSSDFDIASQTMIIGTNGGGLHRINLQNFRITTEKASKYTFPSNYVEKVQIKENKMLIKTNDGVENFENRGTGTSFKLKDNWITFVEPNSLKEINGNEISSIEDMGKNKLIVASGRIFVYENDRRVLKECKILNNEILNNEENMSSIVKKSYNEKTGICYILSSRANSDLFCNMAERLFFGYVRDYIKLNFIDFPVFNISDMFINISVAILIFIIAKNRLYKKTEK